MATSFNVNLSITSAVGFRRASTQTLVFPDGSVSVGGYNAPLPVMTTTLTLEGLSQPDIAITGTRILSVTTTTPFIMYPGQTSSPQEVYITNEGDSPLSLVPPFFQASTPEGVAAFPEIDFVPSNGIIPPGSTGTMTVTYTAGEIAGEYYNWIIIVSDADAGFKLITQQVINNNLNFELDPINYSVTTTQIGERARVTYELVPIFNGISNRSISLPFTLSLSGDPSWKILSTGTNSFTLEFESHDVNNINGPYTSNITVTSGSASFTSSNTANVNIRYEDNYHFASWASPKAPDNSVIGISYDLIDGKKTLTIGVGMGGDGTSVYTEGGSIFYNISALGVGGNYLDFPYSGWAEVYRFSDLGNGTPMTMLSGAINADGEYLYRQKVTPTRDYGKYFESMFTVRDLGNGDVRVYINNLKELSGDEEFDKTLSNLTRAFYYYSPIDVGGRIENLVQYPLEPSSLYPVTNSSTPVPPGETRTQLFKGFNAITTSTFEVVTSLVDIPQ